MNDTTELVTTDWIERQKPCDLCGKPIGVEAMVTGVQSRYHARCFKKLSESDQPK